MTTALSPSAYPRAMAWWLLICAAMIFVMVALGGATRLTESGLSMVEWKPLTILPPLTDEQWQTEFTAYQQSPEFKHKNDWMTVTDFQKIYWLEYTHRLWGRIIGLAFALPFLWFLWKRAVDKPLAFKLTGLFMLGGAQGALGWFMVASGLQDRPDVSQYRLAAHLLLAFVVYGLILWVALDLWPRKRPLAPHEDGAIQGLSLAVVLGVLLTVGAGAFVAGLNAGLIYNTFPLMDGQLVPRGVYPLEPWYLSAFEDVMTVQFNHRVAAITLLALIVATWWRGRRVLTGGPRKLATAVLHMALIQAILGISTLVWVVPLPLALAHQSGALVLYTLAVWFTHEVWMSRRRAIAAPASLHMKPAE